MSFLNGLFQRPVTLFAMFAATVTLSSVATSSVHGQESLEPMDIWYRGFLLVQEAEELESQRDFLTALAKLNEAQPLFMHLSQAYPEFQTEMVRERRHLIEEKRDTLKQLMRAPKSAQPPVTNQTVPPKQPDQIYQAVPIEQGYTIPTPPVGNGAPVRSRNLEIENPEREVLLPSWEEGSSAVIPQNRPPGMPQVRVPSPGQIAGSISSDLKQRDEMVEFLKKENLELRMELSKRKTQLEAVQKDLVDAQTSRADLMEQIRDLERNGGGVGSQQQIEKLKGLLRDATDQLQKATDRNAQLVSALGHSQQEMEKLRNRLAEVERERDNLAEVVRGEGNGGKALRELMDRNRELSAQLDRAEQLATSLSELNKEKDEDIKMLKSEISKIKFERDRLLAENMRHQQSIEQLQRKLELLSDGLSAEERDALSSASPIERQENELLRSIVLKQLRRQAQMKQAKDLLLRQLDKLGSRSDTLLSLVEDMAKGSQLTEEEKKLFKAPQLQELVNAAMGEVEEEVSPEVPAPNMPRSVSGTVSATIVAPGNGAPDDGIIKEQKVSVELAQLDKSARLDFKEGRHAEAEAGFLEYLRYRPRSVSCLCNLAVLKIALKNFSEAEQYLERAIAVENESGLAHYLLGRTYYLQGQLDEALAKLESAITFDPQNAKAHNTVGVISSQKGWVDRAQRAFTNAVSIDPKYGDAHFNLAVLYATRDQPDPKSAEKHYFEALHLGVPRDATIEDFLKQAEAAGESIGMR